MTRRPATLTEKAWLDRLEERWTDFTAQASIARVNHDGPAVAASLRGDHVDKRAAWRWGNVPLPQTYLVGLGAGVLLQMIVPWRPPWPAWVGQASGWPLILAGLSLAAWGVRSAAEVDLEHPHQLVLRGPYAVSRNPMYLAWAIVYVGIALVANTVWPLLLLPLVLLATHVVVVREERFLEGRFGAVYRSYKTSVRRYL